MKTSKITLILLLLCLFSVNVKAQQVPDPDLGLRAQWMRGSLGLLWLPENNYNGNIEGVSIEDFLTQIDHLKTVDFIQVGLASPYIYSPVHTAPHPILEDLWGGDLGPDGKPVNLVVPRASAPDPFLGWLKAIRAAGLKAEVYVNSANLLQWEEFGSAPDVFPDLSDRWKAYCDTDPTVQAFINSQSYHTDGVNDDRRPYMFCYAEFILKEYAMRYGDLIDAWCFDAAHVNIGGGAGDDYSSGDINTQRVYQAFADACHAGNPNAAITFNNGIGDRDSNPFLPYRSPSLFEDYKFGHPFGGAGNMVDPRDPLYTVNFGICEYMRDNNGLPYTNDGIAWNDNVVAHFFPKQSTSSWNDGGVPCLTDAEFVEWNNVGLINGGGITWGTPLVVTNLNNASPNLTLQPYALAQLELVDADLSVNQFPGAPNWARQYTILPEITPGQDYAFDLVEGSDFWDPENVGVTSVEIIAAGAPTWLTIAETSPGVWTLGGTPTETAPTEYIFELKAVDADGERTREVTLKVVTPPNDFTNPGDGSPVWKVTSMDLGTTAAEEFFEYYLQEGVDFYDFEGDDLNVTISSGPNWINLEKLSSGIWYLSGTPEEVHIGDTNFNLNLSDGVNSIENDMKLTVGPIDISKGVSVMVKATTLTNYGIGSVATMISETQTVPDGVATYKISVDVTPPSDKAVISGASGGDSTDYSWGIGDGTAGISDLIFLGTTSDWVENISNIQIIDFNANGGTLTVDKLMTSFKSVFVRNGQSGTDNVSVKVGGVETIIGKTSQVLDGVYLSTETGIDNIQEFSIGTGNTGAKNKWSIESIGVLVKFDETLSINDNSNDDITSFKLYPNPATNEVVLNMPIHSVRVMDITGKVVKVYNSEIQKLDVSQLAPGVYFLKGRSTAGKTLVKKFVKKN
ncbi:T9SS type A sorting domain-containing protein [Tamlana agarivorans]|uniref:T9SS type A sorting domain-containing protein n=1 Tax=Pseudotamlana agarivorans TaxID=481183 RepID=A0ACC5U9G0_9FLAO|nr:T9SS type A sorting domain-containing protein [Tamlana agarivorans]MBU2950911.1 T9SS type A sorting domain-containing protein [Tamlana agarivorans]